MADITTPADDCEVCAKPAEIDNRLKGGAHLRYCYQWRRRNDTSRPVCSTEKCGRRARAGSNDLCDRCYQRAQRGNDPTARPFHQSNKGKTCTVEWCDDVATRLGWCVTCYAWSRRNGDADPAGRRYRYNRTLDDLVALVLTIPPDPTTGCRSSRGVFASYQGGYAITTIAGNRRTQLVTRLVLAHTLGRPLLPAMQACHTCDNPPCVEPSHLWEGTAEENSRDRDAKGRGARGLTNGRSRLTPAAVRDIRARYIPGNNQHEGNVSTLAAEFGVKPPAIRDVVRRRTWVHVL